jgi:L-alanine-DL-glutamate epimerase-like enolase superfamily enzyme
MEQPCASYDENRALRGDCDRPLVLDESIDGLAALVRAHADRVADAVTIKIARVGGVTRARLIRDVAVELGIAVTVEDTGGAEIDTAAMIHLSLSTPEELRLHTCDFNNWVTRANATGIPESRDGAIGIGHTPGLGVVPLVETFGTPFLEVKG